MREVLRNAHFVVTVDRAAKLVRVTRTAAPFDSIEQIEQECIEITEALAFVDRSVMTLLLDIRAAPGRNDPKFEAATLQLRTAAVRGFGRVAVLVQTLAGALQVRRHSREDGVERIIYDDEERLLDYLTATQAQGPTSG
jgi:hypothetical protein